MAFHLGSRFPKGAEMPAKWGKYLFVQKDRPMTGYEINGRTPKLKLNKKMNKSLQYKFFDKYIDVDLYFFAAFMEFYPNTKDTHMCEFFIKDKDIGVTHQVKVYNGRTFGLTLLPNCVAKIYKTYFEGTDRKVLDNKEFRVLYFDVMQRATEEVYGKLPMGLYIIDYEPGNMDKQAKEYADKWRKYVNDEFEKIGYKLVLS